MSLFEVKFEVAREAVDVVDEVLLELGVEGWSVVEDVIAKRAWVVGIFQGAKEASERLGELWPLVAEQRRGEAEFRELGDADWRDSYKAHFHAWKFGRLHWVPVWERESYALPAGDAVLWLDPGLAFGTGNHETTRLCVERLVAIAERTGVGRQGTGEGTSTSTTGGRGRVIDAGCGSGILALSAAKLGYRDVAGFDNDPEAVRVSEENASLNGLQGRVKFFVGDLVTGLAGEQADVLLANILADVLMRFAKELVAAVAPGGSLVLSGVLANECARVQEVFRAAAPGWAMESRTMGEWSDVLLVRLC